MNVQRVELGPKVVQMLRRFDAAYAGGCEHEEADQWAAATSTRSRCIECFRAEGRAPWEAGPCQVCGRATSEEGPRMWAVESTATRTIVVVRACASCTAEETLALGEPEPEEEPMSKGTMLPFRTWLSLTAGADPQPVDPWSRRNTMCCRACATGWIDAAEGRRSALALHADCSRAIGLVAAASAATARRLGTDQPRANRIAAVRGLLAHATASVAA